MSSHDRLPASASMPESQAGTAPPLDPTPPTPAPDGQSGAAGLERIGRLAAQAERRIRLGRALHVGGQAVCLALAASIGVVALRKVGLLGEVPARVLLAGWALAAATATTVAWARRLPDRAGARALDRFYDLRDRLASALVFAETPPAERTAFMEAAMQDAGARTPGLRPRLAVPVVLPRSFGVATGLAALLVGVLLFEVRHHVPLAQAKTIDPVEMSADDLDDVKAFIRQAEQRAPGDETKLAIDEFNKLVDDIAHRRLDRTEAFRRMEALEEKLLTGSEADKKALEEQLERIGEELKKAELTKPAGEALTDHKLDRARDALHQLAKRVRSTDKPVDPAKLDQLRESLKKAAADAEKRQRDLDQRRSELADEILKLKQKTGDGGSDEERSLLEKKQRELDRLDRDLDARKESGRQLDRLDRELEQAAEDLMKDAGLSANDLDRGAEDLNRMENEEMTQQQKEELRQKLQELRELMRQQGQGGKGQIVRLQRFGRMAHGQGGSQGQGGTSGDGQPQQPGDGPQQGQGGDPSGQAGPSGSQAGGGSGGSGQSGEVWIVGPDGQKMLVLQSQGGPGSSEQARGGGAGSGGSNSDWGEGHDPKLQGAATNPKVGTEDTQVQGSDTGQGGSRSQVILGAAERGFASKSYKRVYTEYHQVAEESLTKDEIPGGYRFYVKRYFQLIRPREGQ